MRGFFLLRIKSSRNWFTATFASFRDISLKETIRFQSEQGKTKSRNRKKWKQRQKKLQQIASQFHKIVIASTKIRQTFLIFLFFFMPVKKHLQWRGSHSMEVRAQIIHLTTSQHTHILSTTFAHSNERRKKRQNWYLRRGLLILAISLLIYFMNSDKHFDRISHFGIQTRIKLNFFGKYRASFGFSKEKPRPKKEKKTGANQIRWKENEFVVCFVPASQPIHATLKVM